MENYKKNLIQQQKQPNVTPDQAKFNQMMNQVKSQNPPKKPMKSKMKVKVKGRRAQLSNIRKLQDKGEKMLKKNSFDLAIKAYEECISQFKEMKDYENIQVLSNVYLNLGKSYFSNKNFLKAVENYTHAIDQKSEFFDAYVKRAHARQMLNNLEESFEDLKCAFKIKPNQLLKNQMQALEYKIKYKNIKKATKSPPKSPTVIKQSNPLLFAKRLRYKGDAFMKNNQFQRAIKVYEGCISKFSKLKDKNDNNQIISSVYQNLGQCYFNLKNYAKSEENFTTAIFEMYTQRAKVRAYHLNKEKEALEDFEAALKIQPNQQYIQKEAQLLKQKIQAKIPKKKEIKPIIPALNMEKSHSTPVKEAKPTKEKIVTESKKPKEKKAKSGFGNVFKKNPPNPNSKEISFRPGRRRKQGGKKVGQGQSGGKKPRQKGGNSGGRSDRRRGKGRGTGGNNRGANSSRNQGQNKRKKATKRQDSLDDMIKKRHSQADSSSSSDDDDESEEEEEVVDLKAKNKNKGYQRIGPRHQSLPGKLFSSLQFIDGKMLRSNKKRSAKGKVKTKRGMKFNLDPQVFKIKANKWANIKIAKIPEFKGKKTNISQKQRKRHLGLTKFQRSNRRTCSGPISMSVIKFIDGPVVMKKSTNTHDKKGKVKTKRGIAFNLEEEVLNEKPKYTQKQYTQLDTLQELNESDCESDDSNPDQEESTKNSQQKEKDSQNLSKQKFQLQEEQKDSQKKHS